MPLRLTRSPGDTVFEERGENPAGSLVQSIPAAMILERGRIVAVRAQRVFADEALEGAASRLCPSGLRRGPVEAFS